MIRRIIKQMFSFFIFDWEWTADIIIELMDEC